MKSIIIDTPVMVQMELLKTTLLNLGGADAKILCADIDTSRILKRGLLAKPFLFNHVFIKDGRCHHNVCDLYMSSGCSDGPYSICTGYYLYDDVWRPHSWCTKTYNDHVILVETTSNVTSYYYGYEMYPNEAMDFCNDHA